MSDQVRVMLALAAILAAGAGVGLGIGCIFRWLLLRERPPHDDLDE